MLPNKNDVVHLKFVAIHKSISKLHSKIYPILGYYSFTTTIYTGKTVDKFRSRWNNYKDSDRAFLRGEEIKQKFLHEHFLKDDHHGFEKDVIICLIDKTQSSDPHKREYYWMRTLKTLAPFGLNTEDTY